MTQLYHLRFILRSILEGCFKIRFPFLAISTLMYLRNKQLNVFLQILLFYLRHEKKLINFQLVVKMEEKMVYNKMEESHVINDNYTKASYIDKKKVVMLVSAFLLILIIVISVTVTTSKNSFSNMDKSKTSSLNPPFDTSGNHDTISKKDKLPIRKRIQVHSKVEEIGVHRIQHDGIRICLYQSMLVIA